LEKTPFGGEKKQHWEGEWQKGKSYLRKGTFVFTEKRRKEEVKTFLSENRQNQKKKTDAKLKEGKEATSAAQGDLSVRLKIWSCTKRRLWRERATGKGRFQKKGRKRSCVKFSNSAEA